MFGFAGIRSDVVEEVLTALEDSVRQHLIADVPVGAFLSAGRDSSLIAALAARQSSEPLRTVTLDFDEYRGTLNDEVPVAERVAKLVGAQHTTRRIRRVDFEMARQSILEAMDQPSIDGVNIWFVARPAAQSGLKVALSGLGGDELFGGYPSFWQVPRLERRMRLAAAMPWLGRVFRFVTAPIIRRVVNPKWASLAEYGGTLAGAWLLRRALFLPWELYQVMPVELAREGLASLAVEDDLRVRISGIRNPQLAVMALEMSGYMRNQLLRDADWAGMAHSLEIRVPLVDVVLLRRWLSLTAHRFPLDRQRLIEKANTRVAAMVGKRSKSGFSVPVAHWVSASNARSRAHLGLRPWAQEVAHTFAVPRNGWRITALLTDAYGGIGGIAKFNRDLLTAFAAMPEVGIVTVMPRIIQGEAEAVPAKILFDRAAAGGKLTYTLRVVKNLLSGGHPHLVLCGHLNLLPLAWLFSRLRPCPLVLVVHGIEAWRPHPNRFVRLLVPRVHTVIAVSRYTVAHMRAWSGLKDAQFRLLPNCVDLETFTPRPRNEALARCLGLAERRVLLTVGRLAGQEQYKGFDEVLEVLPQLAHEMPDVVYVIAGDGDDRTRLENKASALGVADRVIFTGFISEEVKIDLYNLADVYIMPGRGEGFGIVYLEAMACGVPTIGSLLDGSRDALRNGMLGQLVDPGEPQQMIEAIRKALAQPSRRPAGLEYFSAQAYCERVGAIVREIARRVQ